MTTFGIRGFNKIVIFDAILLFGLLAMTARNAVDPDLWWHLRTGQLIVETGHVPHSDPFSFTRAGHPWVSHEWLSEVAFYELWKKGGTTALIIFSAIVTTAGFMLLYLRCATKAKRHWAAAATAFGALASAPTWGVRPQMFTFVLASLLFWLVEAAESRPKLFYLVPPLFLFWVNLHAGFAVGLALLLAYGLGLLFEALSGATSWQNIRPLLIRVLLVFTVCLALVPLNPSGAQLYRYPLDTLRSPGMRSFISEWFSPDFHQPLYLPFLLLWLVVLARLATARSQSKARVMVPLVLTAFASLDAARHIPIFVLAALPMISAAQTAPRQSWWLFSSNRRPSANFLRFRPVFNSVVVILMGIFMLMKWVAVIRFQGTTEAELYPDAAVASLRDDRALYNPNMRIFAYYDWGGYVLWKLYPNHRIFVDGRADLYGDDLMKEFRATIQLQNGWRDVLDGWKVETILVPPNCALTQALLIDPGWSAAFSDSKSVVFRRNSPSKRAVKGEQSQPWKPIPPGRQKSEKMFPRLVANLRNYEPM
jgi:hypothetical protein